MTFICPECGSIQPEGSAACSNCGAPLPEASRSGPRLRLSDYLSFSGYTFGVLLLAIGIPCLVGLLCFYLSK